jgi:hypothetical protein
MMGFGSMSERVILRYNDLFDARQLSLIDGKKKKKKKRERGKNYP